MPRFLGIDTSNYTTSAAVYDSVGGTVIQEKLMLPVKEGEKGVRQSDAVFHHTVQLPKVISALSEKTDIGNIAAVGVSVRPRNVVGSYMPCFLCGEGLAESIGRIKGIPVYGTSHQCGHILAALYSAGRLELVNESFIAFHVSGGTTDCLYCVPDGEDIVSVTETGTSLDLKAGQLIDRTGVMLGLKFPCGAELEKLAAESTADPSETGIKPVLRGGSCCLSGFENKLAKMYKEGVPPCDIALCCQYAVAETLLGMAEHAIKEKGRLPIIFAGGVMSNAYIRKHLSERVGGYFAEPEFSRDNGAGAAIFAALRSK